MELKYGLTHSYTLYYSSTAPLLTGINVFRIRSKNNSLELQASFAYTGGGRISHFVVSYRFIGGSEWIRLPGEFLAVPLDNSLLSWGTQITEEQFQYSAVELEIQAVNTNNHFSQASQKVEEIGKLVKIVYEVSACAVSARSYGK